MSALAIHKIANLIDLVNQINWPHLVTLIKTMLGKVRTAIQDGQTDHTIKGRTAQLLRKILKFDDEDPLGFPDTRYCTKDAAAVLDRLMDDPKLRGLREYVNGYGLCKADMKLARGWAQTLTVFMETRREIHTGYVASLRKHFPRSDPCRSPFHSEDEGDGTEDEGSGLEEDEGLKGHPQETEEDEESLPETLTGEMAEEIATDTHSDTVATVAERSSDALFEPID